MFILFLLMQNVLFVHPSFFPETKRRCRFMATNMSLRSLGKVLPNITSASGPTSHPQRASATPLCSWSEASNASHLMKFLSQTTLNSQKASHKTPRLSQKMCGIFFCRKEKTWTVSLTISSLASGSSRFCLMSSWALNRSTSPKSWTCCSFREKMHKFERRK